MPARLGITRRWLRRGLLVGGALVLAGLASLEALRVVATRRGVSEVDLPAGSEIAARAGGADYIDAYRARIRSEATLDAATFTIGREIARTDDEIVWEAGAPGLRFIASYHLGQDSPRHLTLSTVVFYESWVGHVYFFFVRPIHRRAVPFVVSGMLEVDVRT